MSSLMPRRAGQAYGRRMGPPPVVRSSFHATLRSHFGREGRAGRAARALTTAVSALALAVGALTLAPTPATPTRPSTPSRASGSRGVPRSTTGAAQPQRVRRKTL